MTLVDYTHGYTEINVNFRPTLLYKLLLNDWGKYYYRASGIMDTVNPRFSQFYPEDVPWILRNLTTQEYVRSDAIALKPEHIHGPNIKFLGFGEVVLSRIC